MYERTDTIFALSTGGLPAGVAVIRVSGPAVPDTIEALAGPLPPPRVATLRVLRASSGDVIDTGLVLYFPAPRSFTGEPCAEFHVHGGKAVVDALLAVLAGIERVRQAEPGEITQRAFLNGKLDLTATEALADLLAAETEAQRRFAVANHTGAQRALYEAWRRELLSIRAFAEADLDFSDEGDVAAHATDRWGPRAERLAAEIATHVGSYHKAEIIRDGLKVVLVGAPNVGKSSLLNALVKRDVAIVTDVPGTTRDLIEVHLDLDGHKVTLTDTAGIRSDADKVEALGIERAVRAAEAADLILLLSDGKEPYSAWQDGTEPPARTIRLRTKSDLAQTPAGNALAISSVTGEGIDGLLDLLSKTAADASQSRDTLPSRRRHVDTLTRVQAHLSAGRSADIPELAAEELRLGSHELGRLTGLVETEELLGEIFGQFCIGK